MSMYIKYIYATNVYSWQHSETFVRLSQMLCLQRNSPGEIRVGSNVWSRRSGQRLSMESEHEVVLRSTSSWMCCIWMWCTYTCLSVAIDKKYIKIHKNTTFNICSLNGPGWRIQKLEINSCWTRLPGKDASAAADLESNDVFGMCGPQLWLFGTAMSLDESRFLVNEKGPKWCAPHEVKWTITWLRL